MIDNGSQTATATRQTINELQTRFLHPFIFDRRRFDDAGQALITAVIGEHRAWENLRPSADYVADLQEPVVAALFPGASAAESGLFRVPERPSTTWFKDCLMHLPNGTSVPVSIAEGGAIELLLSNQGSGVLSLPLTPGRRDLTIAEALAFNHHIAHGRQGAVAELHIPHPADDQVKWAQMLVGARSLIKPPPDRFAPLDDRIGAPGGSFTLAELIMKLLLPLETFALRSVQKGLSVYTIVRARWESGDNDAAPAPPLGAFGRVAEKVSADSDAGLTVGTLSAGHRLAVGPSGAVHWLEESEGSRPAEAIQRMARARDRFFMPYLTAYFQWLTLQRAVSEAGAITSASAEQQAERLAGMRARLAQFGAGSFQQVSKDDTVQQAYNLTQEGLKISGLWEDVRRVVGEIEAHQALARQAKAADDTAVALGVMLRVRQLAEWLTIIAVAILATLWCYLLISVDGIGRWLAPLLGAITLGAGFYRLRRGPAARKVEPREEAE